MRLHPERRERSKRLCTRQTHPPAWEGEPACRVHTRFGTGVEPGSLRHHEISVSRDPNPLPRSLSIRTPNSVADLHDLPASTGRAFHPSLWAFARPCSCLDTLQCRDPAASVRLLCEEQEPGRGEAKNDQQNSYVTGSRFHRKPRLLRHRAPPCRARVSQIPSCASCERQPCRGQRYFTCGASRVSQEVES